MNKKDYLTTEYMQRYGGSFVKCLAELARHADPVNLEKIKTTWSAYWVKYEKWASTDTETLEVDKSPC